MEGEVTHRKEKQAEETNADFKHLSAWPIKITDATNYSIIKQEKSKNCKNKSSH